MAEEKPEEKFEVYREHLREECIRLACFVRVYRLLHERRHDRLEEMNLAPAFFQTIVQALFSAIILWIDKLFDERSERGFFNFLNFLENNLPMLAIEELKKRRDYPDGHWMLEREKIDLKIIRKDRDKIRSFAPLQSIRMRRDKYHAHFDKDYFFEPKRLGDVASIKWADLEETLALAGEILNRYSAAFDGKLFTLEPANANDVNILLTQLHKARTYGGH